MDYFVLALVPVMMLHGAGYVHCALSPEHFLVMPDGGIALIDLRQARPVGSRSGGTGILGYGAPEQTNVLCPVTAATDVYAAGACLYHLLTGQFPCGGKIARDPVAPGMAPQPPSELNRGVTTPIDDLVLRTLAYAPEERFSTIEEFGTTLVRTFGAVTVVDSRPYTFRSTFWENACAVWNWMASSCETLVERIQMLLQSRGLLVGAVRNARFTKIFPVLLCAAVLIALIAVLVRVIPVVANWGRDFPVTTVHATPAHTCTPSNPTLPAVPLRLRPVASTESVRELRQLPSQDKSPPPLPEPAGANVHIGRR